MPRNALHPDGHAYRVPIVMFPHPLPEVEYIFRIPLIRANIASSLLVASISTTRAELPGIPKRTVKPGNVREGFQLNRKQGYQCQPYQGYADKGYNQCKGRSFHLTNLPPLKSNLSTNETPVAKSCKVSFRILIIIQPIVLQRQDVVALRLLLPVERKGEAVDIGLTDDKSLPGFIISQYREVECLFRTRQLNSAEY